MCGIFGYLGKKHNPLNACLEGLKRLEYRGYDSSGIAGLIKNQLWSLKAVGKIAALEKKIKTRPVNLKIAIGHTRWATHGIANHKNAHPHLDQHQQLAVVHNGIIENHTKIKQFLEKNGIKFTTDTDTEVIAQLISYYYQNQKDLFEAVKNSIANLIGSFAIALIHKDHPDTIIAAAHDCPLVIGFDDKRQETLLSSDPNAFLGRNLNVFYLKTQEIALLHQKNYQVFNTEKQPIVKKTEKLYGQNLTIDKTGFEHFMLKEIFEQPFTLQKALLGHIDEDYGTAFFEKINFSRQELLSCRHIIIIGCGTSYHAGLIGAMMLEDEARIPTHAEIASELRYKNPIVSNDTLVIAISQSGETADTIGAVREIKAKGAKILAICNVKNSTLVRESDSAIFLHAGPEISVCSTKAFTSQLTILNLFSLFMARLRHVSKEEGKKFLSKMLNLPQQIRQILDQTQQIQKLASKYSKYKDFLYLGRRYMYPTSLEAALKLKEISYLNASGYPAGEMKHGPIALLDNKLPVVAFAANQQTYVKILSNLMEIKARNAPILAFAFKNSPELAEIADDVFYLPRTIDPLATFTSSVAGQLFAYFIAKEKGREIDHPRNLAKSVTVE